MKSSNDCNPGIACLYNGRGNWYHNNLCKCKSGKRTSCIKKRNRMILVLGYDAELRVSELMNLTVYTLHFDAEVSYMTIIGKSSKYRNVPLMSKNIEHLKTYLKEFHWVTKFDTPLFYATTHGVKHALSDDTLQNLLKKYAYVSRSLIKMPENVHFHMLPPPNFWIC